MCDLEHCARKPKCFKLCCKHIPVPEKVIYKEEPYICQDNIHSYRCPFKSTRFITDYSLTAPKKVKWQTPKTEMKDEYTEPQQLAKLRLRREYMRNFFKRTFVPHIDKKYSASATIVDTAKTFKSTYTEAFYDEKFKDDIDTKFDHRCLHDPKRKVYDTDNIITVWNPLATKPAMFGKKNIISKPLNEVMDCNVVR